MEVEPPAEPKKQAALPIILTSKERKKLRKQRRREAEREKQEKIQFGLIDKPEPKVRRIVEQTLHSELLLRYTVQTGRDKQIFVPIRGHLN